MEGEKVDREAICRGRQFVLFGESLVEKKLQKKNLEGIVNSGATHIAFNCPICHSLAAKVGKLDDTDKQFCGTIIPTKVKYLDS